jgi:hypothetical protein
MKLLGTIRTHAAPPRRRLDPAHAVQYRPRRAIARRREGRDPRSSVTGIQRDGSPGATTRSVVELPGGTASSTQVSGIHR